MDTFHYETAFCRNLGWVTPEEQQILRGKRVAIAGLGGVGGSHLLTLTRLGVGAFHIADADTFELANFNRQIGATLNHIGRLKVDVLKEMAADINPDLEIRTFPQGVNEDNVNEFIEGVDIYVDGLDFFAVGARRMVFAACAKHDIPAVTAAPLGTGTALLNFLPGKMTFEEYFQMEGCSEQEQLIRFLVGLSPGMLQRGYLVYPEAVDFAAHKGPSTAMSCEICAGVASTQALKLLLKRGKVLSAPRGVQFDPYRNRLGHTWRPGGNRNPIQQLSLFLARRQLRRFRQATTPGVQAIEPQTPIERILDLARWAPSGDNTQPWRFELDTDTHLIVHGSDTREHCVYDLGGRASQIAIGALLESIKIAASGEGLDAKIERRTSMPDTRPTFDVRFVADTEMAVDPLLPYLSVRTTQRRPLSTRPLTEREKTALEQSVGSQFSIHWLQSFSERLSVARLLSMNGKLRLTLPEAYETHRSIIEWNVRRSADRIPDQAVGLDPAGVKLMRWALESWGRVNFLNTYLGGTLLPRIQLDFLPGVACAAHFIIVAAHPPESIDDYNAAGAAWQRLWLTATQLGLWSQPEMTPLIFSSYVRKDLEFTDNKRSLDLAKRVYGRLTELIPSEIIDKAVVMGRVGEGAAPTARSVRLPLKDLRVTAAWSSAQR